jgi:hypothetical protein
MKLERSEPEKPGRSTWAGVSAKAGNLIMTDPDLQDEARAIEDLLESVEPEPTLGLRQDPAERPRRAQIVEFQRDDIPLELDMEWDGSGQDRQFAGDLEPGRHFINHRRCLASGSSRRRSASTSRGSRRPRHCWG